VTSKGVLSCTDEVHKFSYVFFLRLSLSNFIGVLVLFFLKLFFLLLSLNTVLEKKESPFV